MFQPIQVLAGAFPERFRQGLGRRATAFAIALLIEGLLFIMLLALGQTSEPPKPPLVTLSSFDVKPPPPPPQPPVRPKNQAQGKRFTAPVPVPPVPAPSPPQAVQTPPPMIVLPKNQQSFNLANLSNNAPPAKPQAAYGPADTGTFGDSARIGTAPDGSPLYGARWYREPTDDQLAAYRARIRDYGTGWGEINCKTAPDFRVEDCVVIGEYPENSHLGNAVLSAAWQFRVRPPWHAGHSMVGSWVQIVIYTDDDHNLKFHK